MLETTLDVHYSAEGMLETTQDANYSIGGMLETTLNANFSTGGMLETTLDVNYSTMHCRLKAQYKIDSKSVLIHCFILVLY